jgi:hypothetical protein
MALCGTTLGKLAMATCPICKSEAEEIEGDAFDGVWFRCLKHREFGVSDTALHIEMDWRSRSENCVDTYRALQTG